MERERGRDYLKLKWITIYIHKQEKSLMPRRERDFFLLMVLPI